MKKFKDIWIFSDSIAGHEIQSKALASKLSDDITLFHCTIRQPWLSFAPRILPRFGKNIIWQKQQPNISQQPDAIITCGRRMAAIGKYYRRQLNCKHIQILNPGDNPNKYDLLICPEHDKIKGENVIKTQGSLHGISMEWLGKFKCENSANNTVALLLGNPGKSFFKTINELALDIKKHFPKHKIVACGSRRTPKEYHAQIRNSFKQAQLIWLSDSDGENPYLELLACSQIFVVSADSINMVSEACATDKPVIVVGKDTVSPKHKSFLDSVKTRLWNFGDEAIEVEPLEVLKEVEKTVVRYL